jgi:hypothetical protein
MGLTSNARYNSAATNGSYFLRAATEVRLIPDTGNIEVVGECGHRLTVVRPWEAAGWEQRIAEGRKHRRRCWDCPKPPPEGGGG